eukprot:Tbor_TRINITY_DN4132_c0_g1::TRINITY_DN4132_c0_g1_i1::g.26489::m.26489
MSICGRRGAKTKWAKSFFSISVSGMENPDVSEEARCNRCNALLFLGINLATGRVDYCPLVYHLTEPNVCPIGAIVYDKTALLENDKNRVVILETLKHSSDNQKVHCRAAAKYISEVAVLNMTERLKNKDHIAGAAVILLINPKTPANFGAILRACGCFGEGQKTNGNTSAGNRGSLRMNIGQLRSGNETGFTPNSSIGVIFTGSRIVRAIQFGEQKVLEEMLYSDVRRKLATDTMGASESVPQFHLPNIDSIKNLIDDLRILQRESFSEGTPHYVVKFVAVDLIEGAISLPKFQHYFSMRSSGKQSANEVADLVVYIFGPEDGSLTSADVALCDDAVYIHTVGSLNLSASVNVLLYDRLCKKEWIQDDNAVIEMEFCGGKRARSGESLIMDRPLLKRNSNNHTKN